MGLNDLQITTFYFCLHSVPMFLEMGMYVVLDLALPIVTKPDTPGSDTIINIALTTAPSNDCVPNHDSITSVDDTPNVDLINSNNKLLTAGCVDNLSISVNKTKEVTVKFRRGSEDHGHLSSDATSVKKNKTKTKLEPLVWFIHIIFFFSYIIIYCNYIYFDYYYDHCPVFLLTVLAKF